MAEKITAGICTSGSRVKLSVLSAAKFYGLSKKALNQEKVLFPMFDRLLGGCKARITDISTLCVITGPGRFTGLRVGLTLAAALKTLAGVRVYSSTLFDVLGAQAAASKEFRAWAAGKKAPRIAALLHAFKDEYFCQVFLVGGPAGRLGGKTARRQDKGGAETLKLEPVEAPRWFKDTEIAGYLAAQGRDLYIVADAEEKTDIYSLVPAGVEKASARVSKILPDFVIKTGLALKNRNLAPLYLKPAKYELGNNTGKLTVYNRPR
jgi:tRNA threonylcarbamoyl adenosine modification protein YeaZ